jgi:hypothetical protein
MEDSDHLEAPAALTPVKRPPVPIEYGAVWGPQQFWNFWKKNSVAPTRNQTTIPGLFSL